MGTSLERRSTTTNRKAINEISADQEAQMSYGYIVIAGIHSLICTLGVERYYDIHYGYGTIIILNKS